MIIVNTVEKPVVVIPSKYKKYLDEELSLVKTLYKDIREIIIVKRINPKYYLPVPRVEELRDAEDKDPIIIMDRVKPRQMINLLKEIKREILDRVLLILEIFAEHAGSREAKLQIELAKLKHWYPIIKESIRYAKLGELHGFLGAGRYGYEKYYIMLKAKEARIRRELEKLRRIRSIRRKSRVEKGYVNISIVGYTCAGKTTLFNKITGAGKPVGPEPFTTLSPKTSSLVLGNTKVLFTDTVGFIRDLPPEIVEAFYATLEEIVESDIIINVIDSSRGVERVLLEIRESNNIFSKLGVHGKPVIYALNKVDLVNDEVIRSIINEASKVFSIDKEYLIPLSAYTGYNTDKLLGKINELIHGVKTDGKDIRSKIWTQTPTR